MARPSVIITMLAMAAALGGLVYFHASRLGADGSDEPTLATTAPKPAPAPPVAAQTPVVAETEPQVDAPANTPAAPASPPPPTDDFSRWIAETQSSDAKTRAAAIAALVNVPKERSVPVLERVLESGEPQVDRQIALRSLHSMALNDGDKDGAIRDVIRQAMYHSDDAAVTQSAQSVLEDIEAALAEMAQNAQ